MHQYIKKNIWKWIAYSIVTACVGYFMIFIISFAIDIYLYGFKDNQSLSYKYLFLFNKTFQNKIRPHNSSASKIGYIYFYNYKSSQICIIELDQYKMVNLNNISIKNYELESINSEFFKSDVTVTDNRYPYAHILLYPKRQKIDKINIHFKYKIEKIIMNEKYIYIEFESTPLEFNSIEKYSELIFTTISEPPVELIILKKQNTLIFILKYNKREDLKEKTSLLDMVEIK